jgi:hypothetical protein
MQFKNLPRPNFTMHFSASAFDVTSHQFEP